MTPDEQAKELERLNKGRLLREASVEVLPLLEQMREAAIAAIINAHRTAQRDQYVGLAAELSAVETLRGRITRNNKETAHREGKLDHEFTK